MFIVLRNVLSVDAVRDREITTVVDVVVVVIIAVLFLVLITGITWKVLSERGAHKCDGANTGGLLLRGWGFQRDWRNIL